MNEKVRFFHREMEYIDPLMEGRSGWEEYIPHYNTLEDWEKAIAGFMLAMGGKSDGHQFLRRFRPDRDVVYPFEFIGWAGIHSDLGPMFRINTDCFFMGKEPLLFYSDDDLAHGACAEDLARLIDRYSSGLADVKSQMLTLEDGQEVPGITFRLSEATVKETVELGSETVQTRAVGSYLLALPKVGEFSCIMGQIIDRGCIQLHYDYFCMK